MDRVYNTSYNIEYNRKGHQRWENILEFTGEDAKEKAFVSMRKLVNAENPEKEQHRLLRIQVDIMEDSDSIYIFDGCE